MIFLARVFNIYTRESTYRTYALQGSCYVDIVSAFAEFFGGIYVQNTDQSEPDIFGGVSVADDVCADVDIIEAMKKMNANLTARIDNISFYVVKDCTCFLQPLRHI